MYENFTERTSEKKIIFFQNFNQRQCIILENKKDRSSRWQMLFKIGVLKNFASFTGKHLCWSLFLKKLFKKDLLLKETSRQVLSSCSLAPHALVPHVPRATSTSYHTWSRASCVSCLTCSRVLLASCPTCSPASLILHTILLHVSCSLHVLMLLVGQGALVLLILHLLQVF